MPQFTKHTANMESRHITHQSVYDYRPWYGRALSRSGRLGRVACSFMYAPFENQRAKQKWEGLFKRKAKDQSLALTDCTAI
jgi:hypothetical protein